MPNHISNKLTVSGSAERVKEIILFLIRENDQIGEEFFDFNRIVPMPKGIDIESSSDGDLGMGGLLYRGARSYQYGSLHIEWEKAMANAPEKRRADALALGKQYLLNIANHGAKCWYEWSIKNWGTKWNAYDLAYGVAPDGKQVVFNFNTAWSGVPELMSKLVEKFPDLYFEYEYADEDWGCNTGTGFSSEGQLCMSYPANNSDEAMQVYFATHEGEEEYFTKVNGEWRRKDEDYED